MSRGVGRETARRSAMAGGAAALAVAAALVLPSRAAAGTCDRPVAVAVSVQGEVRVKSGEAAEWKIVRLRDPFCPGDVVRVMERSRADLALANETTLRLDQKTQVAFPGAEREKDFWLDVLFGGAYVMSRTPRSFTIHTPYVNAGIDGTEFFVRVEEDRTLLTVFEGRVAATNDRGEVAVAGGQSVVAEADRAPELRIEARPRDAVRWTLFYPPVLDPRPGVLPDWRSRASELLSVGRIEEAGSVIEESLQAEPGNADALALRAVAAVAQNEREEALDLARKAVAADPHSASARIALSYAQQAAFDLEGALSTLREAVKAEPENALARARLSELLLSFGRVDEALDEARKAAGENPDVARAQTVLGFAYLAQIRTKESRAAFERAIGLDQADPLPRLGLGLATIRDGDVDSGRKEIEIAASLDPNDSLIRSYLGKAYYEEKRGKTAETQFSMAKELDPSDPTPYFYDAILKQTSNRPVEALHDLQKSISLNDNRAVYRSRLLLDEDLAARSASLGRIYSDLGFQQLALAEGWKSVNTDPANYSAHRFLADSYAALPRHEIARVSELLQSQLLQPININPIQPSLGHSNLFILEGAGPSSPSFNEFNPLFHRNRFALQGSGVVGNNGTWGEEIVHSAVWNRLSYSLGQFHFETDGFRVNNDLDQDIYNAFVQGSLSYRTSIQAEFRHSDSGSGDLELRFHPDDVFPNERNDLDDGSFRLGLRHSFSPGSDLLGSFVYEEETATQRDEVPDVFTQNVEKKSKSYGAEIQHLLRWRHLNVISGGGYQRIDRDDLIEFTFFPFQPTIVPSASDIRHANLYVYFHLTYPKNLTATIGASGDFRDDREGTTPDRNQFNPKIGVTWSPFPDTTIRAAAFRVLRKTLPFTKQTLEPTQVAGFNQFYDDVLGAESWRYGIALDQKFSPDLFAGAEYSKRDLPFVPVILSDPAKWQERLVRAYLYWTPHEWVALNAEFHYEHLEEEELTAKVVTTRSYPIGMKFFHPCGFFASAKGTYYDQDGEFKRVTDFSLPAESGSDRFWIVDMSAGYRLPRRLGLVSVEGRNLFDQSFRFFDSDPVRPVIQPERAVLFRVTIAL